MSNGDILARKINEYVSEYGTKTVKDADSILRIANLQDRRASIYPTDYCYNRYNKALGDFSGHHLFEYTKDKQFRILGENYPYSGVVLHKPADGPEYIWGYWDNGTLHRGDPNRIPQKIVLRRDNLINGLEAALKQHSAKITIKDKTVVVEKNETLVCSIDIEEEVFQIHGVPAGWEKQTSYNCEFSPVFGCFYFLDTVDECIGEITKITSFVDNNAIQYTSE